MQRNKRHHDSVSLLKALAVPLLSGATHGSSKEFQNTTLLMQASAGLLPRCSPLSPGSDCSVESHSWASSSLLHTLLPSLAWLRSSLPGWEAKSRLLPATSTNLEHTKNSMMSLIPNSSLPS